MSRKLVSLLLMAALVVIPVLTSCSQGTEPAASNGGTPSTESKAAEPSSAAGGGDAASDLPFVTFDWYLGLDPMPDNQMVNDGVNEYLKEKINANVNIHFWPGKEWEQKMTTMVSSGQDLGIIGFGSQSKLDYVTQSTRGAFYPLEELLDKYGQGTKALFSDAIWECMTINGHIYGIPSLKDNCYIISTVYNSEMAEALGIDMANLDYSNWRDNEELYTEALAKRNEMFPEYKQYPLLDNVDREVPYYFALETFLNDSFLAVCNIPGMEEVAGYDTNTAFNFYATPEYREFCIQKQRMVEAGVYAYDYEGKTEWPYSGAELAHVGWGYTYMPENLYGDSCTTKMVVSDHVWTDTNNYFSAGTAISANCKEYERAMMLLELVNTDPEFATMMRFGLEGQHYIINDEGKMQFEGSAKNGGDRADYGYYYWYGAPIGNLTIVNAPESLVGPDGIMLKNMVEYNNNATIPSHMGFVFNLDNVSNEIAACTNVVMEYRDTLRSGQLGSADEVNKAIDEFNAKLTANGVEKIVAEVQTQIDAWNASKS